MPSSNRLGKAALLVIIAALVPSLWLAVAALDMPQLGHFHDEGLYWISAKSLAEGSGYRILSLPGEPYQTKYPPLFPLLLAGVWKLDPSFPHNLRLATVVCWIALPVCLLLAARLLRTMGFGSASAAAICAVLALNPYVLNYSTSLMSELWFSCILLGCILVIHRAGEPGSARWVALAAGLLAGAAYLTRSSGLPLLASGPLYFALRRQYSRAALFVCGMAPAIVAWTWWTNRHMLLATDLTSLYYTNYLGFHLASFSLRDVPVLVWKNAAGMLAGAGDLVAGLREGAVSVILGSFVFAGAARMVRRTGLSPYHLYGGGLILMLLPWHLCAGDRYMRMILPLLPLLAAGLFDLLSDCMVAARRWYDSDSVVRMAAACLAGVAVAGLALPIAAGPVRTLLTAPGSIARERKNLDQDRAAFRWIQANLPRNATFLTGADPVFYLYTGRKACTLIGSPREMYLGDSGKPIDLASRLAAYSHAQGLDYILLNAADPVSTVRGHSKLKELYGSGALILQADHGVE